MLFRSDPPGSGGTIPAAINNAGAITGSYQAANGRYYGFVRRPDGTFQTFDAPGSGTGRGTFPASINDEGVITGNYYSKNNTEVFGFIRSPEGMVTSFDPASESTVCTASPTGLAVTAINHNGVIIGWCSLDSSANTFGGFARYP